MFCTCRFFREDAIIAVYADICEMQSLDYICDPNLVENCEHIYLYLY